MFHGNIKIALSLDGRSTFLTFDDSVKSQVDLKLTLGGYRIQEITRSMLIDCGKKRATQGAGPATLAIDISFIGTLLTHAAAVHGIAVSPEEVRLARVALKRLDLIGDPQERDRRPTQNELDDLVKYFDEKAKATYSSWSHDQICSCHSDETGGYLHNHMG